MALNTILVDVADRLVAYAVEVLEATPAGAPATARWTAGEPSDFCCGAVTVILRRLTPLNPPVVAGGRPIGPGGCDPWVWTSDWTLDVSRSCQPGLGSVYHPLPCPAAERAADVQLLLDMTVVFDEFAARVQKAVTRAVRGGPPPMPGCVAYRPGQVAPYERGECSGVRFDFTLGLQ